MRRIHYAIAVLALTVSACGGGYGEPTEPSSNNPNSPTNPSNPSSPSGPATSASVTVSDNVFTPSSVTIDVGGTVTWTWSGGGYGAAHNVTFANTSIVGSVDRTDGTFARTFNTAGSFAYSCTNHPGMDGTISVQ